MPPIARTAPPPLATRQGAATARRHASRPPHARDTGGVALPRATALALALLALGMLAGPAAADGHGQRGPTLLTVTGGTAAANRGPVDAFHDAFFGFNGVAFEGAIALDHHALRSMTQVSVTASGPGWPGPLEATGPALADVMALAGIAADATLTVTALDGYAATITPQDRAAATWIVAIEADGAPLGIGGRGPTWFLPGTGPTPVAEGEDANWVWSAYLLTVE
ncbi:MAG: hypothetical protein AAFV86_15400 [Pseudomonadota bacterium]